MKQLFTSFLCVFILLGGANKSYGQRLGRESQQQSVRYVTLNAGTPVVIKSTRDIYSDQVTTGQDLDFEIVYDVKVDGHTVISVGAVAKVEVIRARPAQSLGRKGILNVEIKRAIAVDGNWVLLGGEPISREGRKATGGAWAATAAVAVIALPLAPLALFIRGKNAGLKAGTQIETYVRQATDVAIR